MATAIPIACTLEEAERPQREALIEGLGKEMISVHAEGRRARLDFAHSQRAEVEAFVRAESGCCPFFDFQIAEERDRIRLEIAAPVDGEWAVRGLVAGFAAGWGGLL